MAYCIDRVGVLYKQSPAYESMVQCNDNSSECTLYSHVLHCVAICSRSRSIKQGTSVQSLCCASSGRSHDAIARDFTDGESLAEAASSISFITRSAPAATVRNCR